MLVAAYHEDWGDHKPVGLSFCLRKDENLYGRYWGCFEEFDCLHFEACYYKPIEWGISTGIQRFDPGAAAATRSDAASQQPQITACIVSTMSA